MSVPGFNEIFHSYYDTFSVKSSKIQVPDHFDMFVPDNSDDYQCISVISPNMSRGSKKWTINGQWITIGIYRDEGRPTSQRPAIMGLSWTRSGNYITINDQNTPLEVGDVVTIYNTNVSVFKSTVISVNLNSFTVIGSLLGDSEGENGAYLMERETNFYQDYRVFRLLPSFKLISFETILEIFASTAPETMASRRSLYNITSEAKTLIPNGKNRSVNYELPILKTTKAEMLSLQRRFGQVYNEIGDPLKIQYQSQGYPVPVNIVDSKYKNDVITFSQPLKLENSIDNSKNSRIYVYDFYGLDLNDPTRGPFYSSDNVTVGSEISSNGTAKLKVKTNNDGSLIYSGKLCDDYGNLAIGVQPLTNTLVSRKLILPLSLDYFNHPIKSPI